MDRSPMVNNQNNPLRMGAFTPGTGHAARMTYIQTVSSGGIAFCDAIEGCSSMSELDLGSKTF